LIDVWLTAHRIAIVIAAAPVAPVALLVRCPGEISMSSGRLKLPTSPSIDETKETHASRAEEAHTHSFQGITCISF